MPASPAVANRHAPQRPVQATSRLLVTWQEPASRAYHAVGMLYGLADGYEFAYLRHVSEIPEFRPFLGFPHIDRRYRSPHLFPLFAERVMDPSRPDLPLWLHALALDNSASPLEVLGRSGGRRHGDTIELIPEPERASDGATSSVFLVHGVRHQPHASDRIDSLSADEVLLLVDDLDNPHNDRALLVTATDHVPLGWVPDPLLNYVHAVRADRAHTLRVVRANGPDAGLHLRLLARIDGRITAAEWSTVRAQWRPAA